ncbi:MAG: cation-translocating P-type ATPase [Eubacteriaceae bacterium]|nr:cation-translocating P-type ATPase [Eubacteriaceae bacterium]
MDRWLENSPGETLTCSLVSLAALALSFTGTLQYLPFDTAWIAIVLCGIPILTGAFKGVVFEHDIKADLLVSLALIASVICGEYFAAGEVALIMQIGSLLEDYTSAKAEKSLKELIDLTPRTARLITEDGEKTVRAEDVRPGDMLRVFSGETIPVDGVLTEGRGSVDQSVMTGESVPVEAGPGDSVMSGTINAAGAFTMRCEMAPEDSSLQRMIKLTEQAREDRAPIVDAADRWATWLVLFALASSAAVWAVTGEFLRAVTLLVVFCPCAFILATPTAVLAGIGNLAKRGIVIKSGGSLQRFSGIRTAAFDKTGTLTRGCLGVESAKSITGDLTDEEMLILCAAAESMSEHPIGKAVVKCAGAVTPSLPQARDFRIDTSNGVSADVLGRRITAGRLDYLRDNGIDTSPFDPYVTDRDTELLTAVFVSCDGVPAGYILLSDELRENAPRVVSSLRDRGIRIAVLTGDRESAARKVLEPLGDIELNAGLLPSDKMDIIKRYSAENPPVMMIGDGVNDAPALSLADASVAMGSSGAHIASEAADAVLVGDDVMMIPYLLDTAQKVMKKIRTNLTASVIINISAMVLSAMGILNPVTGALWHNVGSVFVVVNAAMLLREKRD